MEEVKTTDAYETKEWPAADNHYTGTNAGTSSRKRNWNCMYVCVCAKELPRVTTPEKIIELVEGCTTDQLIKLEETCVQKQKNDFTLHREMILLTIRNELATRQGKDATKVGSTILEVEGGGR